MEQKLDPTVIQRLEHFPLIWHDLVLKWKVFLGYAIALESGFDCMERSMKIEHFAYQIEDPAAVADWYCQHLGFTVKRGADAPVPVRFLADETEDVMIEIYNNPAVKTPDYLSLHPLILHLAFICDDVEATTKRLVEAGATIVSGPELSPAGDHLAMLRDPWNFAIQLCDRKDPML